MFKILKNKFTVVVVLLLYHQMDLIHSCQYSEWFNAHIVSILSVIYIFICNL